MNLNGLEVFKHFEIRGLLSNEKIEMYHPVDDIAQPNTQSTFGPVSQGEELLPVSGFFSEGNPQVKHALTESKEQRLTFSKKRWIPAEKVSVGDNQVPPMKKSCSEQLAFTTDNCHSASREKLTENQKISLFCSNQSYSAENSFMNEELTERSNVDSFVEVIPKESECDQAVFIQAHAGLLSNAEKPKSKLQGLETSLFSQDRRNAQKEDGGTERRQIPKGGTCKCIV